MTQIKFHKYHNDFNTPYKEKCAYNEVYTKYNVSSNGRYPEWRPLLLMYNKKLSSYDTKLSSYDTKLSSYNKKLSSYHVTLSSYKELVAVYKDERLYQVYALHNAIKA